MSSGKNVFVVYQRSATELTSGVEEGRDPWPFSRIGVLTTDYAFLILITVLGSALRQVYGRGSRRTGLVRCRDGRCAWPPSWFFRWPRRRYSGLLRTRRGGFRGGRRNQSGIRWVGGQRWDRVIRWMSRYRGWPTGRWFWSWIRSRSRSRFRSLSIFLGFSIFHLKRQV